MKFSAILTLTSLLPSTLACSHLLRKRANPNKRAVTFGYQGQIAPDLWSALDVETNSACEGGVTTPGQSPIIVNADVPMADKAGITMDIPNMNVTEFENLGTTLEVLAGGTLTRDGQSFELAQFHFHTPSEHRIMNEYFPMEIHFVFESAAEPASVAVMSVLVDIAEGDTSSDLLGAVFENVDKITTEGAITETGSLDFTSLMQHVNDNEMFTYSGSLTTPPCSGGVRWLISSKPITVDVATYNKAKKIIKYNSRTAQNLFDAAAN